jgi:hypothetical protein
MIDFLIQTGTSSSQAQEEARKGRVANSFPAQALGFRRSVLDSRHTGTLFVLAAISVQRFAPYRMSFDIDWKELSDCMTIQADAEQRSSRETFPSTHQKGNAILCHLQGS